MQRVGSGMRSRQDTVDDLILNGAQQTTFVTQCHEKLIQKRSDSRLTVSARDTDQFQFLGRLAIEVVGDDTGGGSRALHLDVGYIRLHCRRQVFTNDKRRPRSDHLTNKTMPVGMRPLHRDEK